MKQKKSIKAYAEDKYTKTGKEKAVVVTVNLFESDVSFAKERGLNRSLLVRDLFRDYLNKLRAC